MLNQSYLLLGKMYLFSCKLKEEKPRLQLFLLKNNCNSKRKTGKQYKEMEINSISLQDLSYGILIVYYILIMYHYYKVNHCTKNR